MIVSKTKNSCDYKIFQRKSLLTRSKSKRYFNVFNRKTSRCQQIFHSFYQTYRSLWFTIILIFRLFVFIDTLFRNLYNFIENLIQIIRVVYGWIQMIRAIFSAIHLITTRTMLFASHIHRICKLLAILFEPFSNRSFEKSVRSFSSFVFYYYSSNGACYTLKARTKTIANCVRARWRRERTWKISYNDDDKDNMEVFYDASSEEEQVL